MLEEFGGIQKEVIINLRGNAYPYILIDLRTILHMGSLIRLGNPTPESPSLAAHGCSKVC